MGVIKFHLPDNIKIPPGIELQHAAMLSSHDRLPFPGIVTVENGLLTIQRENNESGPMTIPWDIPDTGRLMTPTTTLMERPQPYYLMVELARGKINQVRNQYNDWLMGGLTPIPEVEFLLKQGTNQLREAILDAGLPESAVRGEDALACAFDAADTMTRAYTKQVFGLRHARQGKFDTAFGCRIPKLPSQELQDIYRLSFNTITIPLSWNLIEPDESTYFWDDADRVLEWATKRNLRVYAGPVIDFTPAAMPAWVQENDYDPVTLRSLMCDYVETVVTRYRDRIKRWLITTGSNGTPLFSFPEDELIKLTASAADAAWQIDSELELVIGVAQPWSEYLTTTDYEYSGLIIADTLLRAGLPFHGVEVELLMGTTPRGSYCQDLLSTSRMLDHFGMLGVPISVACSYPSSRKTDPICPGEVVHASGFWKDISPEAQADWASSFLNVMLCKGYIENICWDHFSDVDFHRTPNSGLVDPHGALKPALEKLREIRLTHLA
ncbi:MAG: endo-1,4-beta-xylanase [Zavarzinella sp.]